jgi:hypothetical protein
LVRQKAEGVKRRLVGFEVTDRGIARDDQGIVIDDQPVGKVTSGSPAPFLKKKYRARLCSGRVCNRRTGAQDRRARPARWRTGGEDAFL